jgi:uncharacterized protein (TIGR02444 family)
MAETLKEFALRRYRRAGVVECCLRLQDRAGADVNLLLAAAWLAEQSCVWRHEQVHELIAICADWRQHCILPLRGVRRYLKTHELYERTKALELDAEIYQLHLLHAALRAMTLERASGGEKMDALAANLNIYFDCIAAHQTAGADRQALIAALS